MDFEIYFSDLTEDAQKRILEVFGIADAKEVNWDVFHLTMVAVADC